ncbi:outer membrane protein [Flammeovirgaceae bacterium 311]|nr:outer membrane protein [Flammeovirgaceae bacterium 311]
MNKKYLLAGLLLMMLGPVRAQDLAEVQPSSQEPSAQESPQAKPLTLKEAISYGLKNNEDIAKATYDEEISLNRIQEIRGQGLPQLSATAKLEYFPALPTQILPGILVGQPGSDIPVQFGKDWNAQGGLQVSQLLFNKSFFVGLQAAKSTQDLYRLRTEMAQEEVVYNISSAYLQILQTREQFTVIDANLERLAQLEKILQLQYDNDLVKKVDVNRLKVSRVNLQNQKQSLTTALEQQQNYLKFFMGMPLEQEVILSESEGLATNIIPGSMATNVGQKIEYQLLSKQQELTEYQIKNIRAGYYPSLAAYGSYSYMTQRNQLFGDEIPWFKTSVVGVQLNIPLFDGFQKRSQVRMAELEIRKVAQDMQKVEKNMVVETRNAISQLENSLQAIQAQEQNVALAQDVFNTSNQLYKEGISPLTDLLDSEVALREAQTNLNNERLKYQLAQLSYLRAAGEIDSLIK